jgi:2-hydroxychromene-2-carboxylate isomerase
MAGRLQFWFEFASTYSFLSALRIEQAAEERGITVEWQPFLLGPIFAAQGWKTSPFNLYPAKGRYMWRDMERLCLSRGLPFHPPDPFPQNGLKAARLALVAREAGAAAAFVKSVYISEFCLGQDISDSTVLAECWTGAGLSEDLMKRASDPAIKSALFEQTAKAQALDLFGAPSFIAGGELFWGDDRLDEALNWAASI